MTEAQAKTLNETYKKWGAAGGEQSVPTKRNFIGAQNFHDAT